jgi:hypothetical protein
MNRRHERAAAVLLDGAHEPGQPLPGVWTELSPGFRVDYRAYASVANSSERKHLWAEVYRVQPR